MKVAILSANLGNFDKTIVSPLSNYRGKAGLETVFFRIFTDEDFPPITGLTPRLQYRIPKMFGYEMQPGHDVYIWVDASMGLQHQDSIIWFLEQLGDNDCAFFKHPWRKTIAEEVDHIEDHLQRGKNYIVSRYKNGLHKEFLKYLKGSEYIDDKLFASNVFIYRPNETMKNVFDAWWFYQSRYFTCDQVQLPYALWFWKAKVKTIEENVFKSDHVSLVSPHK